ncbi:hypothetical protein MRB53_008281 [Persea americana]|uniref:Uncharacterized protein n=1 Tax=Persea americana TaxID=3435 RepID=A0ACC2MLZ5_PERAE|nr:hypothetical protein MRB53_008281 [Persea americana]
MPSHFVSPLPSSSTTERQSARVQETEESPSSSSSLAPDLHCHHHRNQICSRGHDRVELLMTMWFLLQRGCAVEEGFSPVIFPSCREPRFTEDLMLLAPDRPSIGGLCRRKAVVGEEGGLGLQSE